MSYQKPIYLESNQVPSHLRQHYSGKQFKAVVCTDMIVPADAGLWSGGSRNQFTALRFHDGYAISMPNQDAAPWDSSRRERKITLSPDFCVVEHSVFCGKDMGLTFYIHPDNANKLLPAPQAEITPYERVVLRATAHLKSSYNGLDRYQMAQGYESAKYLNGAPYPTREQWDAAKQALIARGLLNKAGAITPAGRNAC